MSAFEIVGLVLAVVPLVLKGFQAYPDSKLNQYSKSFIGAKLERREFARKLDLMNSELRFAMLDILTRINVLLTAEQREVLTAYNSMGAQFFDVWSEIWKRNPDETRSAFSHTIEHVRDVIENMVEILNEMLKHTKISPNTGREMLREIIACHNKDKAFAITSFSSRFMFMKSDSKRRKLIKRMGENIEWLKRLNEGQTKVTNFITAGKAVGSQESHGPFLHRVRGYCDTLYHALSNIWQCSCHISPSAMLRLEKRETPETKEINNLRFSLFLTYERSAEGLEGLWTFQETEVSVDQR